MIAILLVLLLVLILFGAGFAVTTSAGSRGRWYRW